MTAIKDISFDDIMRNSEEGIQAAFESIVMPRRQDQPQQVRNITNLAIIQLMV